MKQRSSIHQWKAAASCRFGPIGAAVIFVVLLAGFRAEASLINYASDFSSNIAGWASVGSTSTNVSRIANNSDWDVNDRLVPNGPTPNTPGTFGTPGYEATGDGVRGDGALVMDTVNGTQGDEAIGYTVGGTMSLGESISLRASMFNGNSSFMRASYQLYNLTDNQVLASVIGTVDGNTNSLYRPREISLDYTAVATDVGDVLQIRIVDDANSSARNLWVDNLSLTAVVVPEPSTGFGLLGLAGAAFLRRRRRRLLRVQS